MKALGIFKIYLRHEKWAEPQSGEEAALVSPTKLTRAEAHLHTIRVNRCFIALRSGAESKAPPRSFFDSIHGKKIEMTLC